MLGNQADIRNRGFEFSITWRQQLDQDWYISISPNLGINSNEVTKVISGNNPLYGGGNGITNGGLATRTVQGQPIGEFYGYKVIGVFQNAQQVAGSASAGQAQPGDFIYQDTDHDGVITSKDRVNLGNPNAKKLMEIIACVGLAQNFAAIRSLTTVGIQAGHMKMHLTNILASMQANDEEVGKAKSFFSDKVVSVSAVREFLERLRLKPI